jgi:acid stress-induced BolA-like protein IbaG/YrbA
MYGDHSEVQTAMVALSRRKLEDVLKTDLMLQEPRFDLEKAGGKLSGSVISPTFKGKGDLERQQMMWDALDKEFGADSVQLVGTLLAYTPEEWDVELE